LNTTFGDCHHYFWKGHPFKSWTGKKHDKRAGNWIKLPGKKYKTQLLHAFIDMLPAFSAHFPEYKIIIRPIHPENFVLGKLAAKDLPMCDVDS